MQWYLDASVALHAVLPGGDPRARTWLDRVRTHGDVVSSTLLGLELARVLRREGLSPALARPLLDRVGLISLDDGLLRLAGAIEPHAKSLDAIHLATCLLLGHGVVLTTHDRGMRTAALDVGLETSDPLAIDSKG